MFIAMNRFKVRIGFEDEFEKIWKDRDSRLKEVPGFMEFHLLKGPNAESHQLFVSHTIWASKDSFEAWTRSESFRQAHKSAGDRRHIYLEGPHFEGFEEVPGLTQKTDLAQNCLEDVRQ